MRSIAKKENIKKANILAESLYKKKLDEDYNYSGEEITHTDKQYQNIDKAKDQYFDKISFWLDKHVSNVELKAGLDKYIEFVEKNRLAGIPVEITGQKIRDTWFQH